MAILHSRLIRRAEQLEEKWQRAKANAEAEAGADVVVKCPRCKILEMRIAQLETELDSIQETTGDESCGDSSRNGCDTNFCDDVVLDADQLSESETAGHPQHL